MNTTLRRLLDDRGGVVERSVACGMITEDAVAWAQAHGYIRVPYPGVIVDGALAGDPGLCLRAAVIHAGAGAALSHTSALAIWQLAPAGGLIHVMTGPGRRIRAAGLVAHRRRGFVAEAPAVVTRSDLPVTALATSLVDAWPLLIGDAQRAPLLMALGNRQTTEERVAAALASRANLPGRAGLVDLLRLLAAGCRSPLELWGYQRVFTGPGFERLRWQVPVDLGRRTVWLDAYDDGSCTNFELDGAAYHSSARDRERDLRRDSLLAARGIQVVRFTHARLHTEPDAVRHEALAILTLRRPHPNRAGSIGRLPA